MIRQDRNNYIFPFFLLFVATFVILPQYVYVVGRINIVNASALLFLLLYIVIEAKIIKLKLVELIFPFWLYMAVYAIQFFVTAGVVKGLSFTLSYIIIPYLAVSLIDSEKRLQLTIDSLITGGFVLAIIGIVESAMGSNFIQPLAASGSEFFHEVRYGLLRIMTTFGQPIAYGIFQVFIVTLITYKLTFAQNHRIFYRIAYIVSVANVFLTISRMPIMMLILTQGYFLLKKKGNRTILYVVFLLPIIFIVADILNIKVPFIDDLVTTIISIFTGSTAIGNSANSVVGVGNRFDLWFWVLSSMKGAWIFGHGLTAQFAYEVHAWQIKTSIENQYLQILYYNGIVGLVLLIISYISTVKYTIIQEQKYGCLENEKISFNSIMRVLLLVYYIIELGVQESDMRRLYAIIIALLISYNRINKDRYYREEYPSE